MRYGPSDCELPALVVDADSGEEIKQVLAAYTEGALLEVSTGVVAPNGLEVASRLIKFQRIEPNRPVRPNRFTCYRRKS